MSSPVVAVKTLTVKAWEDFKCEACGAVFDVEATDARMAPAVPLVVADGEKSHTNLKSDTSVACPECGNVHRYPDLDGKGTNKKINLTLLIHPGWLRGSPGRSANSEDFGGTATDDAASTALWNSEWGKNLRLVEVRGELPEFVTCPETGVVLQTDRGTVPKKSNFECGACGRVQDVLDSIKATKKTGPVAAYAIQGYCPHCDVEGRPYNGRFFAGVSDTRTFDAA